jgi:hypothetical protein
MSLCLPTLLSFRSMSGAISQTPVCRSTASPRSDKCLNRCIWAEWACGSCGGRLLTVK